MNKLLTSPTLTFNYLARGNDISLKNQRELDSYRFSLGYKSVKPPQKTSRYRKDIM